MKGRVLIVGGGVMGTAIAVEAARRADPLRGPVVVLEKGEIGSGSSGDSGAILRMLYADRNVALMARDSLREYASFESRTGRSIGFTRSGVLTLAGPERPEWCERIREWVAGLADIGVEIRTVTAKEIRDLVPGIAVSDGAVGAWEPSSGFVDPGRTLQAFASLARSYGAVTRLGVVAEEIRVEGGRVVGARTSEGDYTAEQVVLVAGPWTGGLLESLGIDLPLRILRPENHFVTMLDSETGDPEEARQRDTVADSSGLSFDIEDLSEKTAEDSLAPRGLHPVLIDLERDFYCRCEPGRRRSRIGRAEYQGDEVVDVPGEPLQEISEEARGWSREVLAKRLPDYADQADAGSITSWYTLTPDAQAMIGPVPGIEGLFVVSGFSGHGFKLAPSVGEGVAQMLFDEPITAFDPDFFSPARFRGGEDWSGRFGF